MEEQPDVVPEEGGEAQGEKDGDEEDEEEVVLGGGRVLLLLPAQPDPEEVAERGGGDPEAVAHGVAEEQQEKLGTAKVQSLWHRAEIMRVSHMVWTLD